MSLNNIVLILAVINTQMDNEIPRNNLFLVKCSENKAAQTGDRIDAKTNGIPKRPTETAPATISL